MITYLEYTAGTPKGGVDNGDFFNGVFNMGEMTESRMHYTGQAVVEAVDSFVSGTTKVAWAPAVNGKVRLLDADGNVLAEGADVVVSPTDGATISLATGVSLTGTVKKIAYVYDNVIIPQDKLPTLVANLNTITLTAHARRIAVYYSQIAAFQAKTDYGFDLGDQIAEQAVGELQYEIDSEVVAMLNGGAEADATLNWSKTLPVGVNMRDHYASFAEVIEKAKAVVYKRTQKFAPNYMVIAANILPVITFIQGWNAASVGAINGPYFAGTLNGIKVYVSPMMEDGDFFMGVLGNDLQTAAGVYAPYMPVVPTQLLGFADGTMSQGFSTMYDMKLLSTYVKDGNTYSRLLVKGKVTA